MKASSLGLLITFAGKPQLLKRSLLLTFLLVPLFSGAQNTELLQKPEQNKTVTYQEAIGFYEDLAEQYQSAKLLDYGTTDVGKPLHLFIISPQKAFTPNKLDRAGIPFILVNNGIHPGEPCGIDASMQFAYELLSEGKLEDKVGKSAIGIIPIYNVGGALNRNCCTRANQNGPEMYGFRGNAKNLDLNRDFIKCDSDNAMTFTRIFQLFDPALFIDTHSTNGADYQHTMTLIPTQKDKLSPILAEHLHERMLPDLRRRMKERGYPTAPYVMTMEETPSSGLFAYMETARYSTGYAALFNTIGFVSETHMLKPYEERVKSTEDFLYSCLNYVKKNGQDLLEDKLRADQKVAERDSFALRWELDSSKIDSILFKGFEATYRQSKVTDQKVLHYQNDRPWERKIPYYDDYRATVVRSKPEFYLIPQAWDGVIQRLEKNDVQRERLDKDTTIAVTSYYLHDVKSIDRPYEGHYLHTDVRVERKEEERRFYAGDLLVPTGTAKDRFIVRTLEPEGEDAYFAWNFFDEVLMQKEHFSGYVFDRKAERILEENPEMQEAFEARRRKDSAFAQDHRAQLRFIYRRSKHYEDTHRRYPVARIEE